jgi:hypothetical protein
VGEKVTWESLDKNQRSFFVYHARKLQMASWDQILETEQGMKMTPKQISDCVEFSTVLSAVLESSNVSLPLPETVEGVHRSSHDVMMCELGQFAQDHISRHAARAALRAKQALETSPEPSVKA